MNINQVTYQHIAQNLREFGYPGISANMIGEVHEAMQSNAPLPHGIIGMLAKSQLTEIEEA